MRLVLQEEFTFDSTLLRFLPRRFEVRRRLFDYFLDERDCATDSRRVATVVRRRV